METILKSQILTLLRDTRTALMEGDDPSGNHSQHGLLPCTGGGREGTSTSTLPPYRCCYLPV